MSFILLAHLSKAQEELLWSLAVRRRPFTPLNDFSFVTKGKKKVQGVPQSQTAAHPRHQEKEETDKSKQAQIEQTYEKH